MGVPNPMKPPTMNGGNAFNPLGGPTPFGGGGHHGQPLNGLGGGGGGLMNARGYGGPNYKPPDPTQKMGGYAPPPGMGGSGFLTDSQGGTLPTAAASPAGTNLAAAFMHGMAPANPLQDTYMNHPRTPTNGANSMGTPQFPNGPFNAGNPQPMPPVGAMPLPGSAPQPQPMGRGPQSGQNPLMNPMFRSF